MNYRRKRMQLMCCVLLMVAYLVNNGYSNLIITDRCWIQRIDTGYSWSTHNMTFNVPVGTQFNGSCTCSLHTTAMWYVYRATNTSQLIQKGIGNTKTKCPPPYDTNNCDSVYISLVVNESIILLCMNYNIQYSIPLIINVLQKSSTVNVQSKSSTTNSLVTTSLIESSPFNIQMSTSSREQGSTIILSQQPVMSSDFTSTTVVSVTVTITSRDILPIPSIRHSSATDCINDTVTIVTMAMYAPFIGIILILIATIIALAVRCKSKQEPKVI